jgi:hypothetical protein
MRREVGLLFETVEEKSLRPDIKGDYLASAARTRKIGPRLAEVVERTLS